MMNQLFNKADTDLEVAKSTASLMCEEIDNEEFGFVLIGIMDKIQSAHKAIVDMYNLYRTEKGGVAE